MGVRLASLFAILSTAYAFPHLVRDAGSQAITWALCDQKGLPLPTYCGNLTVPLDYTQPTSNETLTLQLIKINGTQPERNASILFNFGGPGAGGRDTLANLASSLLEMTGGHHDLISWDPRGTGYTIPFLCTDDTSAWQSIISKIPSAANRSDVAFGETWAGTQIKGVSCGASGKNGDLIGTAFVARDMVNIIDALGEDGLLRYWGFSYGTVLGATFATMFPDRVDKVILDGVANMQEYYAGRDVQTVESSDATLSGFFSGCVASPGNCPLATEGKSAKDLEDDFYNWLYKIKYSPMVVGVSIIDYALFKSSIFSFLYDPTVWPKASRYLKGAMDGDALSAINLLYTRPFRAAYFGNLGAHALDGIRCGDTALKTNDSSVLHPVVDALAKTSKFAGELMPSMLMGCAQWPFKAKEVVTINERVTTRSPILFIGNSFDPVTPVGSARNTSALFEDSVVLQHNGHGHCSTGQPSLCTIKAVQEYFINGTLPAPGTICEPSVALFSNVTTQTVIDPPPETRLKARDMTAEDAKLLGALIDFRDRTSGSFKE